MTSCPFKCFFIKPLWQLNTAACETQRWFEHVLFCRLRASVIPVLPRCHPRLLIHSIHLHTTARLRMRMRHMMKIWRLRKTAWTSGNLSVCRTRIKPWLPTYQRKTNVHTHARARAHSWPVHCLLVISGVWKVNRRIYFRKLLFTWSYCMLFQQ